MDVHIADLKAHLSEHLRAVRRGERITVMDRDTPVAVITPYGSTSGLSLRRATLNPSEVALPKKPICSLDAVEVLLEERQTGRR
jgi:prevent-host-death family protein